MERSFDFGALLQNHEKQHKYKPVQFVSVANGVKKRLEVNIKRRKSSRLTIFDRIRNIEQHDSPLPKSDKQQKMEHRRMQLEKWKEEKEKKKKEETTRKKKPFIVGIAHAPARFVPPPPPKVMPSTSGRVTRSQSARNKNIKQTVKNISPNQSNGTSFAPANATFRAPELKLINKVPSLSIPKKQSKTNAVKFEPVLPDIPKKANAKQPVLKSIKIETKNSKKDKQIEISKSSSSTESEVMTTMYRVTRNSKERKNMSNKENKPNIKKLQLNSSNSDENEAQVKLKPSRKSDVVRTSRKGKTSSIIEVEDISSEMNVQSIKKTPRRSLKNSKPSIVSVSSASDSSIESPEEIKMKTPHKSIHSSIKTPRNPTKASPLKRTPLKPIPKSESSSEERLRSPKSPVDVPMTPEQIIEEAKKISPCVTLSRGKDNARKEMKQKIAEGLLDEDLNDMDSIDYFKKQLNSEVKRLTEMCDTWDKISEQIALPDLVQEAVLAAVGQGRLLVSQKLQQFAGLVARCETPDPTRPLVTAADLHGFWDMVFMQVVNVDMRFKKLEEMKSRGWSLEEQPIERKPKKIAAKPKACKPAPTSRLRDMIAAARKAKKEQVSQDIEAKDGDKTFEAGFFSVRSPVRAAPAAPAALATPHRPTLLKAVLSSEAKKASASKNSASIAMLRASLIGKSVDQDSANEEENLIQFTPVNLHATPGRSILKSTGKQPKKSIKCVLFDSTDTDTDTIIDKDISGVDKLEDTVSLDENENKKKLVRQDAIERSPIMTRNRRKSLQTPVKENNKRQTNVLQDSDLNVCTPRRSSRKKSLVEVA